MRLNRRYEPRNRLASTTGSVTRSARRRTQTQRRARIDEAQRHLAPSVMAAPGRLPSSPQRGGDRRPDRSGIAGRVSDPVRIVSYGEMWTYGGKTEMVVLHQLHAGVAE